MAKHRFAPCALGPNWAYKSPMHTCHKHKDAAPEIVQGRVHGLPSNPHPHGQRVGGDVMSHDEIIAMAREAGMEGQAA